MEKIDRHWSKYLPITRAYQIKLCLKQTEQGGFDTTGCKPVEFLNKRCCGCSYADVYTELPQKWLLEAGIISSGENMRKHLESASK